MNITRRQTIKVVFATVGAAASTAFKGCKSSTPDRRTLPMYGEAHWKMMFSGRPMQVGGNPGKGWSAVGVVPSGDIVWIYGLDIGQ